MRELIESRRSGGRVCFIAGKTGAAGDPLKPSRLFFQCPDEELPAVAAKLFAPAPPERVQHPSSVSFKLDAAACPPDVKMPPAKLPVTALRDYLVCPFRFYLKHALRMETLRDDKTGLDSLDFGAMVHHVLEAMARDKHMRECDDPSVLSDFFAARADAWIEARFGRDPSLPILISLDAARRRLAAAAQVQAVLVREGWRIVESEITIETDLGGIRLRGKIDRIDRHSADGRLRVIDYKTSDTESPPAAAHLAAARRGTPGFARVTVAGKERRWIDLQLPLYLLLLQNEGVAAGPSEPAYFNLPKAVTHTGVTAWDGFTDELLESATSCAAAVVERIKQGVFWPPEERTAYDDFESLFQGPAEECFEKL